MVPVISMSLGSRLPFWRWFKLRAMKHQAFLREQRRWTESRQAELLRLHERYMAIKDEVETMRGHK